MKKLTEALTNIMLLIATVMTLLLMAIGVLGLQAIGVKYIAVCWDVSVGMLVSGLLLLVVSVAVLIVVAAVVEECIGKIRRKAKEVSPHSRTCVKLCRECQCNTCNLDDGSCECCGRHSDDCPVLDCPDYVREDEKQ